jgi:hypothetical protein
LSALSTDLLKTVSFVQPMTLEQLLSDRDSEDDNDDQVVDFEGRQVCIPVTILSYCLFPYL